MHVLTDVENWEEWAGPGSLDFGKNKSREWRPGDELPEWWGLAGSSCGGCVACRDEDGVRTYVPVMCKRWACDVCGYYRYAWLTRNIAESIEFERVRYMWTLTLQVEGRGTQDSWDDMQAAWQKLLKRIRYRYGRLEFIWVIETTRKGIAHMHLLVDRWVDQKWLSRAWCDCTGDSYIVFQKVIQDAGAARYLAKYVGKEVRERRLGGLDMKQRHLFGKSRGIPFSEFMGTAQGWDVQMLSWRENATWLLRNAVCELRDDGGIPRLVVELVGPNERLRAWPASQASRAPPTGGNESKK